MPYWTQGHYHSVLFTCGIGRPSHLLGDGVGMESHLIFGWNFVVYYHPLTLSEPD
jgi:hypothetical protein